MNPATIWKHRPHKAKRLLLKGRYHVVKCVFTLVAVWVVAGLSAGCDYNEIIEIRATPTTALIYVDGKKLGESPQKYQASDSFFSGPPPDIKIEARLDGYERGEQLLRSKSILPEAKNYEDVEFTLKPLKE
jgi:hypothetical protein